MPAIVARPLDFHLGNNRRSTMPIALDTSIALPPVPEQRHVNMMESAKDDGSRSMTTHGLASKHDGESGVAVEYGHHPTREEQQLRCKRQRCVLGYTLAFVGIAVLGALTSTMGPLAPQSSSMSSSSSPSFSSRWWNAMPQLLTPLVTREGLIVEGERLNNTTGIDCHVSVMHEMNVDGSSSDAFACQILHQSGQIDSAVTTVDDIYYHLPIPTAEVTSSTPNTTMTAETSAVLSLRNRLVDHLDACLLHTNCVVMLSIPDGQIDASGTAITIPWPDQVVVNIQIDSSSAMEQTQRNLAATKGALRTLLVRISAPDAAPRYSGSALWSNVFSGDGSLMSQLNVCSANQVTLVPARTTALEVTVSSRATNVDRMTLVNQAYPLVLSMIRQLEPSKYGNIQSIDGYADFLMFVVPSGTITSDGSSAWIGRGIRGGRQTVFNDQYGAYLQVLAHEIGHNMGCKHSGEGDSPYRNYVGYMGGTLLSYHDKERFPRNCYDSANHRMLGWFDANTRVVNPANGESALIRVASFTDFSLLKSSSSQYSVIVEIANTKLTFQYNRAKNHNKDTFEYKDRIVIVDDSNADANYFVAGLMSCAEDATLCVYNTQRTGRIEVCARSMDGSIDYALVSMSPFNGPSLCSSGTAPTPSQPTPSPPTPSPPTGGGRNTFFGFTSSGLSSPFTFKGSKGSLGQTSSSTSLTSSTGSSLFGKWKFGK